jgi:citrate synthase
LIFFLFPPWYYGSFIVTVLVSRAMGFPSEFSRVLFAIPHMADWLAHWKEPLDDPDTNRLEVPTGQ